jgi:anti-sigma28 factor (negative regulator of flagellin synthesis)
MAGIQGLGNIPEPVPGRTQNTRDKRPEDTKTSSARDGVQISSAAKDAATANRLTQLAAESPDIRPERVEQAKQNLANNNHKDMDVLRDVARSLLKII